jgi:hypothetical protein
VRTKKVATPAWVKALLVLVGVGVPTWWLADRHDRVTNQHRLEAIASSIAGRAVHVRCPGPVGRVFGGWDTVEGSVRFDADLAPSDETKLRKATCAELDALAERRRGPELACVERGLDCGPGARALANAVDVLTHESFHLKGVLDEGVTECNSLRHMASTAQRLGATEAQAQGLTRLQIEANVPLMPARYRVAGDCPPA